jgi:hypothetical protein
MNHVRESVYICNNEEFWHWLERREYYVWGTVDAKQAANIVRGLCGVKSRSELKDNIAAQKKFEALIREFRRDQAQRSVA